MLKRCLIQELSHFLSKEARKMSFDNSSVGSYDEGYWKACHPTGCCGPDEGCYCYDERYSRCDSESCDDRSVEGCHFYDERYSRCDSESCDDRLVESLEPVKTPVKVKNAAFCFKKNPARINNWFAKRMQQKQLLSPIDAWFAKRMQSVK